MRGNPVMKAKRVTGPTPHTVMHQRIAVRQINGTYPLVNDASGKPVKARKGYVGEPPSVILSRVKAKVRLISPL